MQSLLFLKPADDKPVDRIVNIDLLATAHPNPTEPEKWTDVIVGMANVTIHMPFADFIAKVQELIAQNYKHSVDASLYWQQKRTDDMRDVLSAALKDFHH